MQRFNKVVALLLCVVMLIGFVPVSALAADGAGTVVDAAIIFSDLHTSSGDYKKSTLKGILNGIKNAGVTPSSVTSAGDAFSVNADNTKYTGYTSTLTGYIQSVFAGVPVNYVWSDHDRYAVEADGSTPLDKTSRLVYGAGADGVYGTDDDGNYYIYSLSMGDLCSYDRYSAGFNYTQSSNNRASKGFTSTVDEAIENFKADAAKLNKDRPLFITSHQPLFDNRNDNAFAEDWFDAINEVAKGMDVAFFYGHNHKYDTGSDYYYAKGSKMNVATANNWNWNYEGKPSVDLTSEQKTLNFTHMCAGYMAPSSTGSTSNTTRQGVAVAITIYDDAINYTTYNSSGVYTGNYALNETVTRSFASASVPEETVPETIEPSVPETSEPENENPEIGEELSNSVTIGGQSYEEKTVYVRVDSLASDGKYLIVNTDKNQALINNNGIDGTTGVTVTSGTATVDGTIYNEYIENPAGTAVWTAATNGSGYNLINNGEYLVPRDSNDMVSGSVGSAWTYDGTNNRLSGEVTTTSWWGQSTTTYYVQYANSAWANTTTKSSVYLYKAVEAQVSAGPGTVTYTMQASDLKHNLVGDNKTALLDYALLADGMEATALPTGGKYTFGISGDNHDIIESIAADGTITFTGEHGSCRVKVAYTWTDGDQTYTVYKYVTVSVVTPSNYPEYPDEGAVKVGKTGTGIDFQSSGIAQVEISASGIPIKKGADVIVMLDTSSSMRSCMNCSSNGKPTTHDSYVCTNGGKTRAQALEESLGNLISYFKTPGADGEPMDIKVAIADFNGYYGTNANTTSSGAPYVRDLNDRVNSKEGYQQPSGAQVYTGSHGLNAGAFVDAANLAANYDLKYTSGTNYDYAFDAIYQLGHAIRKANEAAEVERDLYVIFMSDGAALQWNYFASPNDNTEWNNWLTGAWDDEGTVKNHVNPDDHAYYYDLEDHNGDGMRNEHRMANAVKGDPNEKYQIIRKATNGLEDVLTKVGGPGEDYLYEVPGLGATMYAINLDARTDGSITEENIDKVIASLASPQVGTTKTYYKVNSADQLDKAFNAIGSEIAYAAYNARFVDQVGDDYDLQMKTSTYSVVDGTSTTSKTLAPKIEIISYDIYTAGETIPAGKHIGDRKGTYKVLETVTFNANGTEAYSDQINGGKTNILADGTQAGYVKGVIYAKTFLYSTNVTSVAVEGVSIPTGTKSDGTTTGSTNMLPSETFYWKMGTVQTSELAMRYYVYLEGSMEGTREGGSYPTNEYATLYYDNYLHNPCKKDTVSPVLAWKEANVSYAFYLVDENGNIIVNQTTGQTGSFANKIAVTNPVVHKTLELNNDEEVDAIDIVAEGVLPEGYTLYDYDGTNGAKYTVTINSNTTGSWEIEGVKDVQTTYVTQFDPNDASAYSNALTNNTVGNDYTHTVVWFAVVWKIQALPDAVVIDYGLPVDISVLRNDMFGENGKLAGVGAYSDSLNLDGHDAAMASGFGTSYTGTYGTAKADAATGKVRYTPTNMQMNGYEKFAYAVNYTGNENAGCYYDTVTVIPATTIYYEDSFVDTKGYVWQNGGWVESDAPWTTEGERIDGTQAEDRPGQYSLNDANNIYGYDDVYAEMSTFSLGSAKKLHVNYDQYGTFRFTFYGTGFDLISMTSGRTGGITMDVYVGTDTSAAGTLATYIGENGEAQTCRFAVDTYYGYKYENDEWVVTTPDDPNAIYQVPVMEVADLTYGQYTVVVKAQYAPLFDHGQYGDNDADTGKGAYDFYLDAIRIYDPANDGACDGTADTTIEDAYKADGEGWPSYIELRNSLIEAESFTFSTTQEGAVFIDGKDEAVIADYKNYGPNNEVYLAKDQSIAFMLSCPDTVKNIHIGVSAVGNGDVTYEIKNVDGNAKEYSKKVVELKSATDMYYDLTSWKGDIIVITNTGDGILSLTNIKSTYTEKPGMIVSTETPESGEAAEQTVKLLSRMTTFGLNAASVDEMAEAVPAETTAPETQEIKLTSIYMTAEAADLVVAALNAPAQEETPEPTIPEESEPEETEPEAFEPKLFVVTVNNHSVKVGQKVRVTITTSSDVDYVTVNGNAITRPNSDKNGVRTWTLTATAERAGIMNLDVVCYNAADEASEPVNRQIMVRSKNSWEEIYDLIFDIFH